MCFASGAEKLRNYKQNQQMSSLVFPVFFCFRGRNQKQLEKKKKQKHLKNTIGRDIDLIIPGHGPVKKRDEAIEPMISYFDRLITTIRRAHTKNLSLSEVIKNFPNENKENWLLYNIYHPSNVTKVYTELEWE